MTTGALAGVIAGMVMSLAMMLAALLTGESIWTLPNIIGAMWLGGGMAQGLGAQALIGMLTHAATSALMGVIAVPFVAGLPVRRVLLVSLAYALAAYPLVFSLVISWANPLMFERADMLQMTAGHLLFGLVFAISYLRLARRRQSSG